jgi:glycosyltransferase 2 family protein
MLGSGNRGAAAKTALKLAITATLLAWLAHKLDWTSLIAQLRGIDPAFYVGAVAALLGPITLTSFRWQLILRAQQVRLALREVLSFDLVAQFFNAFLPGTTGGDAARAVYAVQRFPDQKTKIIASIVFDRGVGLLVLMVFGYFSLLGQQALFARIESLRVFAVYLPVIAAVVMGSFVAMFALPSTWLPTRLHDSLHALLDNGIVGKLLRFLKEQRSRPMLLLAVIAISVASYLFTFLSFWLVARAMGLPVTFVQMILILAIVHPIVALPISVGGHGVREVVLIGLFKAMSIGSAEQAVAFSLLTVGVQWFWSLIGGGWFLIWRDKPATLQPK